MSLKSKRKRTGGGGGGPSMCVRSFLKRKCRDFQNEVLQLLSSFSYFPIDYNDYNLPACQGMACDCFRQRPHKITNVGNVKNIYLQPLAVGGISM